MSKPKQLFQYRLATTSPRVFPGAHPGRMVASGQLFQRHEPLIASPDPRRLDLRASVLNLFDDYQVRVYRQHNIVDIVALVDLSASMADKRADWLDCLASIAESALSYGDRFRFIGCDSRPRGYPLVMCSSAGVLAALIRDLRQRRLASGGPRWQQCLPYLPAGRALVFVLTDGHFGLGVWRALLHRLKVHAVVPLLLGYDEDCLALPRWGLLSFQDAETGRYRTVLMRPSYRQAIMDAYAERKRQLQNLCRAYGSEPLFLNTPYHAAQMQQYFWAKPA